MSIHKALSDLASEIKSRNSEDYRKTHEFVSKTPPSSKDIENQEIKIKCPYPPSFREFIEMYGLFTLGIDDVSQAHLVFRIWNLDEHKTALDWYAEVSGCEATTAALADLLGMEVEIVESLSQIFLVGIEGQDDLCGFDLRTRNQKTGECAFTTLLLEDSEIERFAKAKVPPCEGRGFDAWLQEHIQNRAD